MVAFGLVRIGERKFRDGFVKGAAFDGWRGWYYALQRMLAETMLSLRLLERRLGD